MPTTLTSLLLFVILLLPGFVYLTGKERSGTERHVSPFRETVTIITASVTTEIAVLILFAIIRTGWPSLTPDVGALVRGGSTYLRDHYQEFAIWGASLLAFSVALAYTVTIPALRSTLAKWHLVGEYPHSSAVSAWWMLFERLAGDRQIEVGCVLDDGSYMRGHLRSFNTSADDDADRELVLVAPITYRPAGDEEEYEYPVSTACISARHIVTMFVNYLEEAATSSAGAEAVQAASTVAELTS
ncbi:MAG TPA: DUF6338 family protein [Candidatus Dormibacteraeota bacterium]|nr:DUF6338 family protein [Candidatus Dormibacteraeota bacterium]